MRTPRLTSTTSAGIASGLVAGVAYTTVQEVDLRLTGSNTDDLALFGGLFTSDRRLARALGLMQHLAVSATIGVLFQRYVAPRARDRVVPAAVACLTAEHVGGFMLTKPFQYHHPWIRDGRLDPYWTWTSFLQATARHLVFGIVLGLCTPRER